MSGPKLSIVADCTGCDWLRASTHIPPPRPNFGREGVPLVSTYDCAHPQSAHLTGLLFQHNTTRTPESCPLLPAARAAYVQSLTVPSGVVIDGREV